MKKHLLFNQSFGTVGSPNQTDETQTRENRVGLMSYLHRTLMLLFAVLVMSMANVGMAWGADVTETRTASNDSEGMRNDGTYVKAVTLGDANASWSSNKLKIGSSKSTTFDVEINDTYSSTYSIKSIVFTYDGSGRPSSFSGNSIAVTSNTTWSAGATTPTKVTFSLSTGGSEVKIQQMVITLTPSAPATTWYVKGNFDSWGDGFNFTGTGTELTATVNITTAGSYEFKINNSDGNKWYGNGGNIGCNVSGWTFDSDANCKFFASETGNYTFTFNTETKKLSVTYPTAQGKYYYKNTGSWGAVYVYRFKGGINNGWPGTQVVETENICGDTYYFTYADPGTTLIFDNSGSQTGDMAASGNAGKYVKGTETSWSTFNYNVTYDKNGGTGTAPTDATNYSSGASVPVKDNTNLAKSGYYFAGWNTKADGSGTTYVLGQTFEITTCTTLYAKWVAVSCPDGSVEGTVFSLTSPTGTVSVPATSSVTITSSQATITNGMATMINGQGSAKNIISSDKINFGHGNTVLRLNLGCALAAGDVISFTSANYKLMVSKTNSTSPGTNNFVVQPSKTENCTIPAGSNLIGLKEVYVIRAEGNTTTFTSLTITRPASGCTAPTGLSAGSVTAKGATFTVTDGANTNNYEFYVSKNSTAPTAETEATYTSTSKSKTIDNLVAGTKYYAWVRSKCSASNKSDWSSGCNFTTSTVTVTHTLTNVTKTSGAETAGGSEYTAVYAPASEFSMPTPVVTIDGNTATSGTDYTWSSGTLTIPANKINGNIVITLNSATAAPTNVAISGTYHYYPGETISLTATPTGGNGPVTYQWYHGGTADGDAIDGATSATFTKSNCVVGDAGDYYCKVTCGGSASRWSDGATEYTPFKVKIMQFLLKDSNGDDIGDPHALVKGADAQHASLILNLTGGTTYKFRVTDGCGNWYGNSDATGMTSSNCTNWTMPHNADCKMTTGLKTANYTFNFDFTSGLLGSEMKVSIVYPGGNQAADKVIYWDNSVLNWDDGDQWYRIGKSNHHSKTQMTKVFGTANLYKVTTAAYDGFEYWHIANNQGNGDGNLFWTKGDAAKAITNAMEFEGAPVTLDAITVTPTNSHATGETSDNDNCEFYTHTTVSGMKTDRVTITEPSNGTISVAYTDVEGASQSFTSGNRDLAHTVIITPTATPNTGYALSSLTVREVAHTSGNTYTVTANTTIAATFSPASYTVTLNTNDGTINAGNVTSYTYGTGATLPTNVTKDGFSFGGWYDNEGLTGSAVTTISTTATGNKTYWAKWTPAGTTYYLVTSTAQLNTTDTYVIMADDKSAMMGVATGSNEYLNKITSGFTAAADKSTVTVTSSDVNTLTLKSESDAWNLFGKDSHYITTNSDVNGNLYGNATTGSGTDDFVFSFADGKVTIKRNKTTNYHIYYSSGTGFNQSTSSTNIRLYTSSAPAECSAAGLAYATDAVAKNVGDAAFTNALTNPHSVVVTYGSSVPGVATVNETSGMVTIVGAGSTTITATWAGNATYCTGTATYTLTVSSGCTPQSLVKTQLTSVNAGTTTGYNDGQYAGDPVIATFEDTKVDGGYKLKGNSKLFVTLKGGFVEGDKINIVVTQASDLTNVGKLLIFYDASTPKLLTTIDAESAGTYTYTLTAANITTLGSTTTIGVYRPSTGDNVSNPLVKSVEVEGCRGWDVCTAPDAVAAGSVTGEGATFTITDALNTNNYEIYYSTSSTAPTAETSATISGISTKSRAVTGLTAETTYYYWVRSNCGGATKSSWVAGTPASFMTAAAAATHSVTYDGNENTGGDVPTDATAYEEGDVVTVKGNTGNLVKTGYSFVGWNTASDGTGVFYPAGYKFYMGDADVTLYAVWGSTGATCVTLTDFETGSHDKSSGKPDSEGKYFYGYKGTKSATYAVTITTPGTGTVGVNGGDNLQMAQNTRFNIYADNTTTSGTPATFSNITSISFKIKAVKNTKIPTIDVYVGSTKVRTVIGGDESKSDGHVYDTSGYTTISITGLASLSGIVKFVNTSSGSSDYKALFDDIQICYGSGAASGFTVSFDMNGYGSAIADIENVPSGSMIGAPIPAPTAAGVEFGGWYKEAGCSNEWDFASDVVSTDKTLYAQWTGCAPAISVHPSGNTYTQNAAASAMSVTATGEGLNYQWYTSENDDEDISGSSAIPGATSASYTPSTSLLGTIYYFCVVSNTCGNAVSNKAAITVNDSNPAPTAVWTGTEASPKSGGKGWTVTVAAKKNDGSTKWDGDLTTSMLSASAGVTLSGLTVDNTNKTITGTYSLPAGVASPITFTLTLPATGTQAAASLDHPVSFTPCAGGGVGDSYNVRVRKDYEKDASNNYRWVTAGAGEITYAVNSSISSAKASSAVGEFDSIMSNDKQYVWVKTYESNTKTIRLHVETSGANISVNALYKNTVYATAADKDIVSSDDYSVSYDGSGSAENTGAKGTHYMDITFDSPLAANDIICVKFSSSKVKAYGAVLTTVGDGGDQTTGLSWSNSQASGATLVKREDAADFAITAVRDATALKSLGLISYTSSNTAIATIDGATGLVHIADNIDFGSDEFKTTTITATLAASGCYKKAVITYILKVTKYVCEDDPGTIEVTATNCSSQTLRVSGYKAGATIKWYRDGAEIPSATSAEYTATVAGEYYVVTHKTCDITSTNSINVSFTAATAEKIVDQWYVKNGRRTPDIALVQTKNATSFTVTSGGTPVENIGGCTFERKDDGIIYLHGQKEDGSAPSDMTAGDMTITITVSGCAGALSGLDITIHKQAETPKPSVAFVVDGTTRAKGGTATSVSADKTSNRDLWKYLNNTFALTGCNVYWSVDSKELREYYSQFDAILITDDPNTQTKGTGGVPYVKAFGTMVDVRPILTLEAYVGRYSDGGWHVYNADPSSPNPRQVEMKLECKNHDIFVGLDPETSDNVRTTTDEHGNEYWHVIMVDTTVAPYHNTSKDYKALPALQGFDKKKFSNMLGVGTIAEETLQAGVERQEEPAARMMILGIQNEAMAALTIEGKLIIKNAIEYLLKTNMEDVNDCSSYFTGGPSETGDNWATAENWSSGKVPDYETRVRILRPVVISGGTKAIVARVDIATSGKSKWVTGECNGKVTVNSQGALIVGGKIRRADAPHFGIDNLEPTENDDLIVKASTDAPHHQGALIFDNSDGDTHAVVEMWNPSHWKMDGSKKKKYWSYVAVPIQEADIPNFFWHGFTYLYDETSGWIKKGDGTSLYPFQGIGASLQTGNMETFYGPLATTESQDITLTKTDAAGQGMNLIGNSWTAPIQIANFEEDDFGDATAEVWVFNTGHTNDGHSTMTDGSSGTTTAGQWQTIPIGVAGLPGYTGLKVIPAMQAFEVNTTSETTLHLDYDRLVRAGRENLNEPMRAPRRSAAKQIEATMRVRVSGGSTHTDVYLLKDARFSDGFDNGWDGHYLSGDDRSAQLYAISEEEGALAFMAQPEIEGTQLGFAPSKEGNEYTFSFSYDGEEEYYLNDLKLTTATLISGENSYLFTYEEGDSNRFYISRQPLGAPAITTGVDNAREEAKPRKFIYNNKMYILYNGRVFDATGKVVK